MNKLSFLRTYSILCLLSSFIVSCSTKIPVARQHFVEQSTHTLPIKTRTVVKALFGDINVDGDLDIILLTDSNVTNEQIIYMENIGRGKFKDKTLTKIPELHGKFQEVRLLDINEDEALDIILLGDVPDKGLNSSLGQNIASEKKRDYLLINALGRSFIDQTSTYLPEIGNGYEEIKEADMDNDKDIDLLITGATVPTLLLINTGKGMFRNETLSRLPTVDKGIKEALLGDFNSDGTIDIFFAMENKKNIILINNGIGIFTNETEVMLPKVIDNATDAVAGDIDNDNDLDIIVAVKELTTDIAKTSNINKLDNYEPFANSNFEQAGMAPGWTAGTWQIWSMNENITQDQTKPLPEDGTYYAVSYNSTDGESAVGTLVSDSFIIPFNAKTLSFLKTGWDGQFGDRNKNYFYLKDKNGNILRKATPPLSDTWELHVWDVTDLGQETVTFEAVDDNSDPTYASIGVDALTFSNTEIQDERWKREENYLLINDGKGLFNDEAFDTPPTKITYRVDLFDADNDDDLDLFIFGEYGASLLINNGRGEFRDETYARLPGADTNFGEIDYGDIDNDNDLDIVAIQDGQGRLLLNKLNPKIILENIQKLKDLIVGMPTKYFKNDALKQFTSSIGGKEGLIALLQEAETTQLSEVKKNFYDIAIKRLDNEFLQKSDGCRLLGKPDENDWIIDCTVQQQVESIVKDTIEVIKSVK